MKSRIFSPWIRLVPRYSSFRLWTKRRVCG